jgi:hypothetical protein
VIKYPLNLIGCVYFQQHSGACWDSKRQARQSDDDNDSFHAIPP